MVFVMKEFRPIKQEKIVISIRIDSELLKKIDLLSSKLDISRNELIVQGVEFALDNFKQ